MESVLFGKEEDDDARYNTIQLMQKKNLSFQNFFRFIYLEDCGHSIEVGGMDHWMETESNNEEGSVAIQMKSCPRCKTLIRSSFRYGDIIKKSFLILKLEEQVKIDYKIYLYIFSVPSCNSA